MDYLLYLLILIIPIIANVYINSTYGKYKKVNNKNKLNGFEVARQILDSNGLENIYIIENQGELSDHYDPTRKVIKLSPDVFHGETVASIAIAAHEVGHAIQDKENYNFLKIRSSLFPFVKITSNAAYIFLILSMFLDIMGMFWLSIALMIFSLSFQLVTLPVEFDASKRAKEQLLKLKLVNQSEYEGVDEMLKSAAMTYVASLTSSILEILRLVVISRNNNRRR